MVICNKKIEGMRSFMKKMKKLLTLLLIAALLVSIIPMAAMAVRAPDAQLVQLLSDETELRPNPFTDVRENHWFYWYVRDLYHFDIMTGTTPTTFTPNGTLTRAMVVAVLYRLEHVILGEDPLMGELSADFSDVPAHAWFAGYVDWAASWGIVEGTGGGRFSPDANVTREQFAVMMYRWAEDFIGIDMNVPASFNLNNYFADSGQVSSWALEAMRWAVYNEMVTGTTSNTITPSGTATRAQCAMILMRYVQLFES